MMFRMTILVATLTLCNAGLESEWAVFKYEFSKEYDADEEFIRKYIFQANLKLIDDHNERFARGETSYYLGVNQFADMTLLEFSAKMNRITTEVGSFEDSVPINVSDLPLSMDWRDKGAVTRVKDQGNCASSWAFSATGAIEGQHFLATGDLVSLSESNLIDCSWDWGNPGCNGGLMTNSFEYVIDNRGIAKEESYPYVDREGYCDFDHKNIGATISAFKRIAPGSESALQDAVANIGPISATIDANHASFQFYKEGLYDEPNCINKYLNHGVLVTGYDSNNSKDFWLVKNSWGETWGNKGYMKMSRNKDNQCGIASDASYPVL